MAITNESLRNINEWKSEIKKILEKLKKNFELDESKINQLVQEIVNEAGK